MMTWRTRRTFPVPLTNFWSKTVNTSVKNVVLTYILVIFLWQKTLFAADIYIYIWSICQKHLKKKLGGVVVIVGFDTNLFWSLQKYTQFFSLTKKKKRPTPVRFVNSPP